MAPMLRSEKDMAEFADAGMISAIDETTISIFTFVACIGLLLIVFICSWCCESEGGGNSSKNRAGLRAESKSSQGSASNSPKALVSMQIAHARSERVSIAFALNWFRAMDSVVNGNDQGTLVASPYAIQTACALWYLGLNETLEAHMVKALFPGCAPKSDDVKTVLRTMNKATKWWRRKSIHVANRLYAPQNCRYAPSYRRQISNLFGGQQFLQVDFLANEASLVDSINRWLVAVTKGRARSLIRSLNQQKQTGLLMVSAIFVDASAHLQYSFDRYATRFGEQFFASATSQTACDFMWQKRDLCFYEDDQCQLLRLSYVGSEDMGLYVFLPRLSDGLPQFEATLTTDVLLQYLNACYTATPTEIDVPVRLPKIDASVELNHTKLLEVLSTLGCSTTEIFVRGKSAKDEDDEGNFSKLVHVPKRPKGKRSEKRVKDALGIWIAQMVHKVSFELQDTFRDSESMASTSISNRSTSVKSTTAGNKDGQKAPSATRFNADHPFLFMLVIETPKIPILIGRFCGR